MPSIMRQDSRAHRGQDPPVTSPLMEGGNATNGGYYRELQNVCSSATIKGEPRIIVAKPTTPQSNTTLREDGLCFTAGRSTLVSWTILMGLEYELSRMRQGDYCGRITRRG